MAPGQLCLIGSKRTEGERGTTLMFAVGKSKKIRDVKLTPERRARLMRELAQQTEREESGKSW